jgi:hypothetical protein
MAVAVVGAIDSRFRSREVKGRLSAPNRSALIYFSPEPHCAPNILKSYLRVSRRTFR